VKAIDVQSPVSTVYPGHSVSRYNSPVIDAYQTQSASAQSNSQAQLRADIAAADTQADVAIVSAANADYGALFQSHEEWFRAAGAKRQEVYRSLQGEAMDIIRALTEAEARSNSLMGRLGDLDALITEEKAKWQAKLGEDMSYSPAGYAR
jgi:hypothetical protein